VIEIYPVIAANGFEWIDIINPSNEELQQAAETYHLHPAAIQDCMQPEHLPKYEVIDDTHFIICRYFDEQCDKHADSIQDLTNKLAIFYSKNRLITIHRQQRDRFDELIEKYKDHHATIDVVCKLIKSCLGSYETPVNKLDSEIDFYESRIFLKKRIPDLLKSLYRIKRQMYAMRKLINLSKEIVEKIAENAPKRNAFVQDLRDFYIKTDTQIENVYDNIFSLLNIYISLSSQRTNEVGVYGMNFSYMPELKHPWGYPGVIIVMLLITAIVWSWFKRKGWM
jgi:magnesium transporter